ncbi:universal stress protein [Actinoplanes sp. NPDC024001]|uniref:universal stress protein n=1 Tax=Actinoplanes sp. NPDC024001 TaxID=3154598 RepID=UPI0033CA3B36
MNLESAGTVVVGVNASAASRRAVEAGAREAAARGCGLDLVHAFNWEDSEEPPASLLQRALAEARAVAPEVRAESHCLEGSPADVLLRRSRSAALTVIGDGDLSAHTCLPREALAVQVAARAAGTVLVMRSAPAAPGPVVAGVNDAAADRHTLEFAVDSAAGRKADLVVIQAWESDRPDPSVAELAEARHAQIRVIQGRPDVVLLDAARDAALVVVGARCRHPYSGLLGWVAQTMLHHSPAPVALVRGTHP